MKLQRSTSFIDPLMQEIVEEEKICELEAKQKEKKPEEDHNQEQAVLNQLPLTIQAEPDEECATDSELE